MSLYENKHLIINPLLQYLPEHESQRTWRAIRTVGKFKHCISVDQRSSKEVQDKGS